MENQEQIDLIKRLFSIRTKILKSTNREEILLLIKEAINASISIQPFINPKLREPHYKKESKARAISLLESEITLTQDENYYDLETIHFQISLSITMLMLNFVDGGIGRVNEIADN